MTHENAFRLRAAGPGNSGCAPDRRAPPRDHDRYQQTIYPRMDARGVWCDSCGVWHWRGGARVASNAGYRGQWLVEVEMRPGVWHVISSPMPLRKAGAIAMSYARRGVWPGSIGCHAGSGPDLP